jgi:hypothetical protein
MFYDYKTYMIMRIFGLRLQKTEGNRDGKQAEALGKVILRDDEIKDDELRDT